MKVLWCFVVLSAIYSAVTEGQTTTKGFINIDCGETSGTTFQGILYVSDDSYIDTGENHNIDPTYPSSTNQARTLRSFPNGTRNCYTLWNVTKGEKYLVRATFLYGNYDGKQTVQTSSPIQFDLYIDVSFWRRVKITDASVEYAHEVVMVPAREFIWVCLVNISAGTPFISTLELRPLKSNLYQYAFQNQSNAILYRLNYGPTKSKIVRYPDDPYDRLWHWHLYDTSILKSINTTASITHYSSDNFEAPYSVLQTALTPVSSSNLTTVSFDVTSDNPHPNLPLYYAVLHMTELQELSGNQSRQYDIYLNDFKWFPALKPPYCKAYYLANSGFQLQYFSHNVFTLVQLSNSTLPPILNAIEVYWSMTIEANQLTSTTDVSGIMSVKADYQIVRNWNGDPCFPTNFSWHGVGCNTDEPRQITSLNLSYSGLSGIISDSFAKLQSITYLDLSHNNLSGDVPDSLASMEKLQVLNLTGNNLNGHVPDTLIKKNNSRLLLLLIDSCSTCGANSNKNTSTVIITISAVVVAVVVVIMGFLLLILGRRTRRRGSTAEQYSETQLTQVHSEMRKFTYEELKDITNSFSRTIGSGGFGNVYHGCLENQMEVAVKVCFQESTERNKQFLAEVRSLSLVHHRNLVTLVGYCKDGVNLAVVYEYLPRGSLLDHLRGKDSSCAPLNWRMRINIMLEAAQALDYLHTGCGIMHRDVKSSNILLGKHFVAKISDLGLARMFSTDENSLLITLCGTPGYMDPEYQRTFKFTEKSDVYSFGVILLEIVTGEPPILNARESIHIIDLVKQKLAKGSMKDMVDSTFEGEYDTNSVRKVVELAMMCTSDESANRPMMADVVVHLKDCLQIEEHRGKLEPSEKSDTNE